MQIKLEVIGRDPKELIPNKLNNELFSDSQNDEAYLELKASIALVGILQPLIITKSDNTRSGNKRLKCALELGLTSVPCIVENDSDELKELQQSSECSDELLETYLTIAHDLKKKDTVLSKLKKLETLNAIYDIHQGVRSDKNPALAGYVKERDKVASKSGRTKLQNIRKNLEIAFHDDKKKQDDWLLAQGDKATLKTVLKDTSKLAGKITNDPDLSGVKYDLVTEQIHIHNQSCFDLSIIPDKSIQSIVTSPPYFLMRPSQVGVESSEEIGTEKDIELYTDRLVDCFVRCIPKLTADATIWVNLADVMRQGGFKGAPELFLVKMIRAGFICCDKVHWVKTSAQPGDGDNSFQNVEYLLKFSLTPTPYVNYEWLNETSDFDGSTFGKGARIKLSSFVNLKRGFVTTNIANTGKLRRACSLAGFHLEHSSTFPPEIAYMCIKLSCREKSHVLDLFNGCGNSAVALLYADMGLTYHGIELNCLSVRASQINLDKIHGLMPASKIIPLNLDTETNKAA